MKDKDKTKGQLLDDLVKLRQHVNKLEAMEAQLEETNKTLRQEIDKRKHVEEVLWESERKLFTLIDNLPGIAFRCRNDQNWTMEFLSGRCVELTGYEPSDLIRNRKLSYNDLIHPDDKGPVWDQIQENLAKGRRYQLEYRIQSASGKHKWVWEQGAGIFNDDGELVAIEGFICDITKHKRVEEALRLDESRLEALFEFSQMAEASLHEITDFALEQAIRLTRSKIGYLAFMNEDETILTMHSWSKSAMKECAVTDKPIVYPLETTGLWGEPARQRKPIITNDYSAQNPLKRGYPKGHVHLNRHMSIPVFDEDRIVAVAGVANKNEKYDESDVRQLTLLMQGMWRFLERKRADEELRKHRNQLEELVQQRTADLIESEEKYRTLVETLPLVVYRVSPRGETLFVNHFVEEIFGYRPDEMFRNRELWKESVYDEDRVKLEKLREKSFRKGEEFIAEYRVRHKNGHIVYVMDHAVPFEAADGHISSLDGIIMDITGRMKLQEELVRAEGLKTISEVSARLAHEIRNPLVSAGGFARRLLSSIGQDDPNRAKVEIILREVGRLETILRMMLNYIQPFELYKSPTDPNQLVERALYAVEMEIKERNVHLDLQLAPGLLEISVDRHQMELVVETLLKQALNQLPEGATLSIRTFQENEILNLVMRYPVRHMAPDDVEHFFYPFTTSQMEYDTGDLPMSKVLVDKHGGTIDVSLEDSGELVVHISLPHAQTSEVYPIV